MTSTITNENGQLVSCVGPDAVEAFRLRALIGALRLEAKGMKMSRGSSALSIAKGLTGLNTRKYDAQIAALTELMNSAVVKCNVVSS